MSILHDIVEKKKQTLALQKENAQIDIWEQTIQGMPKPPSFYEAIAKKGLSIIGEIKKASPSKGIIREDFDPVELAREYGDVVDALSVLTEEHFFMGSPTYLQQVRQVTALPLLRKDFIIDPIQIYEARILGASCILLITAILSEEQLRDYIKLATALQMDALVEVHTAAEVEKALAVGSKIIGINNRNLEDFSITLDTTIQLRQKIPQDILIISESGIDSQKDLMTLGAVHIDGILVGESFMKAQSITEKAEEFRRGYDSTK